MNNSRTNMNRTRYQSSDQNLFQALIYRVYVSWSRHLATRSGSKKKVTMSFSDRSRDIVHTIYNSGWFNLSTMTRAGLALVVVLGFCYGYQVNKTVAITAEYSQIESQLTTAKNDLSKASMAIAAAEQRLDSHENMINEQVEPSGFVSRDVETAFTANTLIGS